jgi:hypothetical protein
LFLAVLLVVSVLASNELAAFAWPGVSVAQHVCARFAIYNIPLVLAAGLLVDVVTYTLLFWVAVIIRKRFQVTSRNT